MSITQSIYRDAKQQLLSGASAPEYFDTPHESAAYKLAVQQVAEHGSAR